MKQIITIVFLMISCSLFAQVSVPAGQRNTGPLTTQDADVLRHIEEVTLPDAYRNKSLPQYIDNSQKDWFRPIFSQTSFPNCMQSTSIAYSFTYEMCRLRNLSAQNEDNQYGTHFAWNFFNGGNGWFGVNYLQTMDVLQYHGVPTVTEYGGFYYGEGERWMSGYDEYYAAMNNRISGIRKIYTGSEEGILTLKHWLVDHLDGSETGGVASFMASSPYGMQEFPEGTPNAGKKVMITFQPRAEHGLTIVGYHDSVRYDYNNDGQYTNHLDINGDGVVNAKDWEMGAFKFANSHGEQFGDQGYAYMMYKTLADEFEHGGIWESTVHVLDVKEEHHTQMTFKVGMEHDYRERIRVQVGLTENLESSIPEHIQSYTIFNFQGGNNYMAGVDTMPENKFIEFGLDVSPLLSFTEPGKAYKFFLIVDERDPENLATGKINYFSLMDYQNGFQEIACEQQNVALNENGRTTLSIIHTPNSDPIIITNTELPVYEAGQTMEVQLQATGGETPYTWNLDQNYPVNYGTGDFPTTNENQIMEYNWEESKVVQHLDFDFPFYGNSFDSVIVSSYGYVAFDDQMYFWSYIVDAAYYLKNMRVVAPLISEHLQVFNEEFSGVWYEGDANKATFRWETGIYEGAYGGVNFAITLYPNGNIEFHYGDIYVEDEILWVAGISDGDLVNNSLPLMPMNPNDIPAGTTIKFFAPQQPEEVQLSKEGLLSIMETEDHTNTDIKVFVTDNTLVSTSKVFNLNDGLEVILTVSESGSNIIQSGGLNTLDLTLRNRSNLAMSDISITALCDHPLLDFIDGQEQIAILPAGGTVEIPAAFSCEADVEMRNGEAISVHFECVNTDFLYDYQLMLNARAPDIQLKQFLLLTDNGILELGEKATLRIDIVNTGMQASMNTFANLYCSNAGITIDDGGPIELGDIDAGGTKSMVFGITADFSFDYGSMVELTFEVEDEDGRKEIIDIELMAGKVPVCVVDMDPGQQSGPQIYELLQQMEINSIYTSAFPETFRAYQSVILCLGTQFSYHELNYIQALALRDYLNEGGDLYMEGRKIWTQTEIDFLLEKFNVETNAVPGLYPIIDGVDSTFSAGLSFETVTTQPYCSYYMEPISPAYSIFTGREDYPYCISVAHDAGSYQTVSMIFELGSMLSSDTSKLEDYMQGMLDFFGVIESSLSIDEIPDGHFAEAEQNYPNPFTSETKIPLQLDARAMVDAAVYDLQGRRIYELQGPAMLEKGSYVFSWNATNSGGNPVPGGIYLYRISIDGRLVTGKMILIK